MSYTLSLIYKGVNGTNGIYTGLYMGLCLPQECNDNEHKPIVNTLNMVLAKLVPGLYVGDIIDNPYALEA